MIISKDTQEFSGSRGIGTVVFLASLTFLAHEVSWHRMLSVAVGATVTASTAVLAAFMVGFGAGAWVWGRKGETSSEPGRLLGRLLAGLAVSALVAYRMFTAGVPALYGALGDGGDVVVFLVALLVMAVPSFLMGGVYPLASRLAVTSDASVGGVLGRLYALETLGSAVGGLVTGFVLLGTLGQRGTVGAAVALDFGLAAWLLTRFRHENAGTSVEVPPIAVPRKGKKKGKAEPAAPRRSVMIATFACGFAAIGLQVLWMRMLRIYLTNTSYGFALISSLAVTGIFLGSSLYARRSRSGNVPGMADLRNAVALMGVLSALGLLVFARLPQVLMFPFQSLLSDPATRVFGLPAVAGVLLVVPVLACSGFAFPLACRLYAAGRSRLGGDVGEVLSVNTLGSAVGPVVAAFVLLPWLGAGKAVLLIATLLLAAAWAASVTGAGRYVLATGALVSAILTAAGPEMRILPPSFHRFDRDVLFYRETVEGTISVGRDRGTRTESKYTFVNNSAVIGSTYDAVKVVKMVGHYPFLIGRDIRDALVIGFGIGVTTSAIASHPEVETIRVVELVEGLRDAAVHYRDMNHGVYDDPRLAMVQGDGRHWLQRTDETYDLISCDPTHPILGSGSLYTRDYFELCRSRLNPGGVVSQYLPLHKLGTAEAMGIIRTFGSAFPHCSVWLGQFHAVLLGSTDPVDVDFMTWAVETQALGQDPHFYVDPHHLAATLVLDGEAVARLGADLPDNTDDLSYTEFFDPACLDEANLARNVAWLHANRVEVGTVFSNLDDPLRMERFVQGNRLMTEALIHRLEGDPDAGLESLRRACAANPEDGEYPFLIRLYY